VVEEPFCLRRGRYEEARGEDEPKPVSDGARDDSTTTGQEKYLDWKPIGYDDSF